jgi:Cof subfamily protein (haloacid dehalogenase superfamily)
MNAYKLLAVDIDGTLCMPGQEIPMEVVESLKKCVNSNILVVPSTGKKFTSIQTLCERIGIEGPVITCNGAIAIVAKTQKILFSHFLSKTLYSTIISTLENDERTSIAVFTEHDIVCTSVNFASRALRSIGEPTTRFVYSLLNLSSENVAKVLVAVEDPKALRSVYDFYSHKYAQDCSVTITGDKFVEFMSLNVSKGKALLNIAKSNGIMRQNIACIGDSDNDLSMFEVAGLSIAVANATPAVLQAADMVVPTASERGVVDAINNLILGKTNGT